MAKRTTRKKAKAGFFTKLLILVLMAALGWQLYSLRTKLKDAKVQKQQLAAQIEKKQEENDTLQDSIDRSGSEEETEKIARNDLGLVSPGEKIFYDVSN